MAFPDTVLSLACLTKTELKTLKSNRSLETSEIGKIRQTCFRNVCLENKSTNGNWA